jgi:hypothetical protein
VLEYTCPKEWLSVLEYMALLVMVESAKGSLKLKSWSESVVLPV